MALGDLDELRLRRAIRQLRLLVRAGEGRGSARLLVVGRCALQAEVLLLRPSLHRLFVHDGDRLLVHDQAVQAHLRCHLLRRQQLRICLALESWVVSARPQVRGPFEANVRVHRRATILATPGHLNERKRLLQRILKRGIVR